jgi:hypothetical protein
MRLPLLFIAFALVACGQDPDYFSVEEAMDPTNCMDCHPDHYREWSGSMHAYAADDPVFLAMNQRGQEETDGALGDFCVNCHAPMAVRLGLTTDGTNLADVPQYAKGVTCYFCHSVESIGEDHNGDLTIASDGVMRGGLVDPPPAPSPRHRSVYSELLASNSQESSRMCGACHDVVTPAGVHLEQTFAEWGQTVFASENPLQHLSCGNCHMVPRTGVVAEAEGVDVPLRSDVREHTFASIDVALTAWPEQEAQLAAIQRDLGPTLLPRICVTPDQGGRLDYRLDNIGAGHMVPSGVAHDRRMWAEIHVYDAAGAELFATGVVPDGVDPDPLADPDLWEMQEKVFDDAGNPVKYFWEVREVDRTGLLTPAVTTDRNDPRFDHSVTRSWPVSTFFQQIARVTAEVHIRPLPFDVLDDLMASGHLTLDLSPQVPTHTIEGSVLEWRPELADLGGCVNP